DSKFIEVFLKDGHLLKDWYQDKKFLSIDEDSILSDCWNTEGLRYMHGSMLKQNSKCFIEWT
ncbi:15873_t:CDS:1, partial [Dentiscutata heterogama]